MGDLRPQTREALSSLTWLLQELGQKYLMHATSFRGECLFLIIVKCVSCEIEAQFPSSGNVPEVRSMFQNRASHQPSAISQGPIDSSLVSFWCHAEPSCRLLCYELWYQMSQVTVLGM